MSFSHLRHKRLYLLTNISYKGEVTFIAVQRMFTSHFNRIPCNQQICMRGRNVLYACTNRKLLCLKVISVWAVLHTLLTWTQHSVTVMHTIKNWKYINIKCTISGSFSNLRCRGYIYRLKVWLFGEVFTGKIQAISIKIHANGEFGVRIFPHMFSSIFYPWHFVNVKWIEFSMD